MFIPIAVLCCARALILDGWAHVDAVRVTGFERVAEGQPHAFTVLRSKDEFAINCARDIDGALGGIVRTEVRNGDGIFTWIAGSPHFVLQLQGSTAPEWIESLLPAKLTPTELQGGAVKDSGSIGKKLADEGEDEVASRNCYVVSLSDETPLVQNLWIDERTGMVLRQLDTVANQVVYERRLSSFEPDPLVTDASFSLPDDSVVIKGLVSPQILTEAQAVHSSSQYDVDLGGIRSASRYGQGKWILKALVPANFSYMGSNSTNLGASPDDLYFDGFLSQPEENRVQMPSFGGIPSGWTDPGQVALVGGRIYFGFPAVPTMQSRGILSVDAVAQGATSIIQPTAFMGPDGTIYHVSAANTDEAQTSANGASGSQSQSDGSATPASPPTPPLGVDFQLMVRSDFLDEKTGDTVSFVQLRNLPMKMAFPGIRLPGPEPLESTKLKNLMGYDVPSTMPMKAIEWRGDDETIYVLISTSLSYQDLQQIAERA